MSTRTKVEKRNLANLFQRFLAILSPPAISYIPYHTNDGLHDALLIVTQVIGIPVQPLKNPEGLSMDRRLEFYLKHYQLAWRIVSLENNHWWNKDSGPLLGFLETESRAVALLPAHQGGYILVDPVSGNHQELTSELASQLSVTAIMFFKTFSDRVFTVWDVFKFILHNNKLDMFRLWGMGILAGILTLAIPLSIELLFYSLIPESQSVKLVELILVLSGTIVIIGIFSWISSLTFLRLDGRTELNLGVAVINRLFNSPIAFFKRYNFGDLIQRTLCLDSLIQLYSDHAEMFFLSGLFIFVSLIFMFSINVFLASIASIIIIIAMVISALIKYQSLKAEVELLSAEGNVSQCLFDILTGISKLRVAGAEVRAFVQWGEKFAHVVKCSFTAKSISNYLVAGQAAFLILAITIIFGLISLNNIPIDLSQFLAFYAALIQALLATSIFNQKLVLFLNVIPLFQHLKPILEALPEVNRAKVDPGELRGGIEMSHVSFRYQQNDKLILDDVSFQVNAGEFIAIVGPSGSGKTTLFRLLIGMEKHDLGAIYFDEQDEDDIDIQVVRSQISYVAQHDKLMSGSFYTNIIGSVQASLDQAWEAADLVGLAEEIKLMPMKLHTHISESAETISSGQKQRILLARALIKKPKVLLMDEVGSTVDNMTQSIINKNLTQLSMTRLVITHHLGTILAADRILVMDHGRIVEIGTYTELMKKNSFFAKLMNH